MLGNVKVSDNIVICEKGGCTVAGRTTHPRLHFTLVEDLNGMAKKQAEVEINKKKESKKKVKKMEGGKGLSPVIISSHRHREHSFLCTCLTFGSCTNAAPLPPAGWLPVVMNLSASIIVWDETREEG